MDRKYPIVRLLREQKNQPRIPGRKPGGFLAKLPYQRQIERLEEKFQQASEYLRHLAEGVEIAVDPRTAVPDRALVFELIGPISGFEVAVQALGFEWLGAQLAPEDDEVAADAAAKVMYMTLPTQESMRKLLSQWEDFKRRGDAAPPPEGMGALWGMFSYLHDIRRWAIQDRLDPSIARYVAAMLAQDPQREVLIEFNFWYRSNEADRARAIATLDEMLKETGGKRIDFVEVAEIGYQGALVQLPAGVAKQLSEAHGGLAKLEDVMSIRPQSICEPAAELTAQLELPDLEAPPQLTGPCIAAVLDGYPVTGHKTLSGRMSVHEVEVKAADVPVAQRRHGTAMASLALHGDLQAGAPALTRRISVVPVLVGNSKNGQECMPQGKLAIGVIHRALQAIVNADDRTHPDLAKVTLINHSLGDTFAPFARRPSPWATLLDYYSHEHRLLFVVSAGNVTSSMPVDAYADAAAFNAANPIEREAAIMTSLAVATGQRGLLAPAESINSITVGATHADDSAQGFGAQIDPYPQHRMPNLVSALGPGVNRSIKPDMLHSGGRFAVVAANSPGGGVTVSAKSSVHVGQLVAAPSASGDLGHTTRMSGTSNAAILVTRAAIQLADALDVAFDGDDLHWLDRSTRAVILKALLAHGCSWGEIGSLLERTYPPTDPNQWQRRRNTIAKLLGYGEMDVSRVMAGADNRITLLADDEVLHDKLHEYRLPIPQAMLRNKEVRSITMTLAWTTPVVPTTIDYRGVALKMVPRSGKGDYWEGVDRDGGSQPNGNTAEKGTLIQLKLSGNRLKKEAVDGGIFVGVQAMARHPSMRQEPIPYALAVTMEVAQSVKTAGLYEQVRHAIASRAQQRDAIRARRIK